MHPQTDAELAAFNEGVRIARIPSDVHASDAVTGDVAKYQPTGDAARALDTLGDDLYHHWWNRGWYSVRS